MPKDTRKKRVKGNSFDEDEFLKDLHDELENISEMFDELRRRLPEESDYDSPYVYGFSVRIDPQGRPVVEEYGSIDEACGEEIDLPDDAEPLIDVLDNESDVSVLMELPGLEKKDIGIKVEERRLEIKVRSQKMGFCKRIPFRFKLKPETAKASYNNGVLDIRIERVAKPKEASGFDVRIE